jgi:hypothetical protein
MNGSEAYIGWDSGNNNMFERYKSIFDTNIGSATGQYYSSQSMYMRNFTGGKVLFNPSTNTYTVSLGHPYYLLNGTAVSNVTLTGHTGEIALVPDFSKMLSAYGSTQGDPNWNPIYDFSGDGIINILDIILYARYYNST